MLNKKSWFSYS